MKELIKAYIDDKRHAWSATTKRSEHARLNAIAAVLTLPPSKLWGRLSHLNPYSRVTAWTRVCTFYDWLIENNHVDFPFNPYRAWRKVNAKQFKHVYRRKLPKIDYKEAKRRIENDILDREIRQKALELLSNGTRYSESNTTTSANQRWPDDSSTVIGKGGKERRVYGQKSQEAEAFQKSYSTVLRALKGIGLTPHMLRKIFATHLARSGFKEADLCHVMGWTSFETARSYIAPMEEDEIASKIKELTR